MDLTDCILIRRLHCTGTETFLIFDGVVMGMVGPGAMYKLTFTAPGKYPYHCVVYLWMARLVDIVEFFG
jgi:plastocyanin